MIALDTNAVVRVLVEDDDAQAEKVRTVIRRAEAHGQRIILLSEVLIETVWVLESVYHCNRDEILMLIDTLLDIPALCLPDSTVIRGAVRQFRKGGDFADLLIVGLAKQHGADNLFSFDKKLQKRFPGFVTDSVPMSH